MKCKEYVTKPTWWKVTGKKGLIKKSSKTKICLHSNTKGVIVKDGMPVKKHKGKWAVSIKR